MTVAYVTKRDVVGRPACCASCGSAAAHGVAALTVLRSTSGDPVSGQVVLPGESLSAVANCGTCDADVEFSIFDLNGNVILTGSDSCGGREDTGTWNFVAPLAEGAYRLRAAYVGGTWFCGGFHGGGSDEVVFSVSRNAGHPKPPPNPGDCGLFGLTCAAAGVQNIVKWTAIGAIGLATVVVAVRVGPLLSVPRKRGA